MKTPAHTLEQLDVALDTVEELLRELPLTPYQQSELVGMVYTMYEVAQSAVNEHYAQLEVDSTAN